MHSLTLGGIGLVQGRVWRVPGSKRSVGKCGGKVWVPMLTDLGDGGGHTVKYSEGWAGCVL